MKMLLEKLNNAAITIQDNITVKIIHSPSPKFKRYFTVFNKKARNEKILLDLDELLKSLEKEKMYMMGKSLVE